MQEHPDRNLALELVRATESAALAAGRWMGRGNRNGADQAAVNAMRVSLNSIAMDGVVVIGEGEKDRAPMLFNGERLGSGSDPKVDIAVDPVEGTRLLALGHLGAISAVAVAERDSIYAPGHVAYMEKIAVGPEAADAIDINAPVEANLQAVARARSVDVDDLTVVVLDRPRHEDLILQIRKTGARIKLITDGDLLGGMMTALPGTGVDVLVGVGGSPEAVILACAFKCLGGNLQCKLWSRDEREREIGIGAGLDFNQVLTVNDLVRSDNVFVSVTGVTDGEMLRGVRYFGNGGSTESIVMRSKSGTVRRIEATHRWDKLMKFSQIAYDPDAYDPETYAGQGA